MDFSTITLLGLVALFLALFNFSMYFLFLWIRKSGKRSLRKNLAYLARKFMKLHRSVAFICTVFIILHVYFGFKSGIPFSSIKVTSGFAASILFIILLTSGWIRQRKATGRRRRSHKTAAFLFILFSLLHVFLPKII